MQVPNANIPAPGVSFFTPAQNPPAGTTLQNDGQPIPKLFQPIKIRGVEFPNRIFLSPLCQYSAQDGKPTPWHMAHLGGIIQRGPGLTFVEATAVTPEGRITPEDTGIWSDEHASLLGHIVEFAHSQNQKIAIQLAHAGRKASTVAPWISRKGDPLASEAIGGWPSNVWAPSPIPWSAAYPHPKQLTKEGIQRIIQAFVDGAKRAVQVGFDVIEIHNAHGFLLHEFVSPVSNKRTDEYGGSFENRIRLTLEIVDAIRAVIPQDMPLFLRISATDCLEESLTTTPSWRMEDTARLAPILFSHGVDLLDISTAGNHPMQRLKPGPGYQAPLSQFVRRTLDPNQQPQLLVGAVGGITTGKLAQEVLDKGQADVIFVGRQFLRNPGTVWAFADELGVQVRLANQIGWAFSGRIRGYTAKK